MRFLLISGHLQLCVNWNYLGEMNRTELVLTDKIRNDKLC